VLLGAPVKFFQEIKKASTVSLGGYKSSLRSLLILVALTIVPRPFELKESNQKSEYKP